jgi:Peptidase propeptide and YPEB domain
MRNYYYVLPIVAVVVLSTAAPAMACDSGGLISMQRALAVATDLGLVTVSHTQFAGDEWQIEGRDMSGRYMEVDVEARTGEVLNVDR